MLDCMVEVVDLSPGEKRPHGGEDDPWMEVRCTRDGFFFGTGSGYREDGERVHYISHSENDVSLERALTAALEWAGRRGVATLYVVRDAGLPAAG
jgi:hypothetical protein